MNILRYFGLDVKRCPVCDQNELPGHVCKQPARWSRRGFLFLLAAAPVVASIAPASKNALLTVKEFDVATEESWSAAIEMLKVGDRFTIQNIFKINPASTGQMKRFIVTAVNSYDGINATLNLSASENVARGR